MSKDKSIRFWQSIAARDKQQIRNLRELNEQTAGAVIVLKAQNDALRQENERLKEHRNP